MRIFGSVSLHCTADALANGLTAGMDGPILPTVRYFRIFVCVCVCIHTHTYDVRLAVRAGGLVIGFEPFFPPYT